LEPQLIGEFSITQQILMAAYSIQGLERRCELLQVGYHTDVYMHA